MTKYDIRERAMEFAVRTAKLITKAPKSQVILEYGKQLIRASASVGANIEEADGTLSKRDFVNKMAIARREARESKYWLQLIHRIDILNTSDLATEIKWLTGEANELLLILSSIVNKVRCSG